MTIYWEVKIQGAATLAVPFTYCSYFIIV